MAQERPDFVRPTAQTHLTLARVAALATSCAAAFAVGLGIFPEAWANGGGYVALPFVAAAVVAILLSSGWHVAMGYAAHARKLHEKAIAFAIAVVLFLVGVGCSAWFFASNIEGNAAVQAHQHEYLDRLMAAANVAAANAASERNILSAIDSAASNLDRTARAEGSTGIVSGRVGQSVVYTALKNGAATMGDMKNALGTKGEERDDLLARAREHIREAQQASAARNLALFQESVADAASDIAAANAIRFAPMLVGLGNGFAPGHARSVIDETVSNVHAAALAISKQRRTVDIPAYEPIDAKHAILSHPQPLAWVVAIVIELLPLVLFGLLLALWRDPEEEAKPETGADVERFRPRPGLTAAE
jgi:hypothetical protein